MVCCYLGETPCKRRQIDLKLDQEWEKTDITEEDHLNTAGEVYLCLHGNRSKLQAAASRLQLVGSCSCPAGHRLQGNPVLLSHSSLLIPVLGYLAGWEGFTASTSNRISLGADHAHPGSHFYSSASSAEVGVRPGLFCWTRAHLCPSWAQTCVLLCTDIAGRLYSKKLCYFIRKTTNSHGGVFQVR